MGGTHGFYCFRHKGLYYVVYNHLDSYPKELGEKLVNQLRNLEPQDLRNLLENVIVVLIDREDQYPILSLDIIEKFRNIILQDPSYFESIHQRYPACERITMSDASMFNEWLNNTFKYKDQKWCYLFEKLFANNTLKIDKALSFGFIPVAYTPDVTAPKNDQHIKWIYVIDLDNETFSVKNGSRVAEFDYHNIPQNWINKFSDEQNMPDICSVGIFL